jgi:protein tyrosine phosphatase (PTP) superfamily phosphohydrolase (DUF442 family)
VPKKSNDNNILKVCRKILRCVLLYNAQNDKRGMTQNEKEREFFTIILECA